MRKTRGMRRGLWSFVLSWGYDCPLKTWIPSQTVFSVKLLRGAVFHGTRQSRHGCPLPGSLCSPVVAYIPFLAQSETCLLSTCGTCPWHVKRILHHRSWVAASFPPVASARLPFFFHSSLPFSILSCRGKRGPEESNNCDSGAFLALFLKLCRHTQGCLLALMKG